jgi:hypothetical protein
MTKLKMMWMAATIAVGATLAQAQMTVKHIQTDKAAIATGVWAGDTYYLSGQLASPITPADAAKGIQVDYGDMKRRRRASLAKFRRL